MVQLRGNSCSSTPLKKRSCKLDKFFRDKLQFVNSVKCLAFNLTKIPFLNCFISIYRVAFYLTKIPFFNCFISIYRLTVDTEVLNDQNLFTESNLSDLFSSYVQFYSGGRFSELAAAAR